MPACLRRSVSSTHSTGVTERCRIGDRRDYNRELSCLLPRQLEALIKERDWERHGKVFGEMKERQNAFDKSLYEEALY